MSCAFSQSMRFTRMFASTPLQRIGHLLSCPGRIPAWPCGMPGRVSEEA
jgi:hypothetical protein